MGGKRTLHLRTSWSTLSNMQPIDPSVVPGSTYNDAMIWWLEQQQDPAQLHRVALNWNWDRDTRPLRYIVDQPICDKGTALSIFFMAEPDLYAVHNPSGPYHDPNYRKPIHEPLPDPDGEGIVEPIWLIRRIAENWAAGLYETYRYYPDESAVFYLTQRPPHLKISPTNLPWPVPSDLCAAVPQGEQLDMKGFNTGDGYPDVLIDVFDARPDIMPG